MYTFDHGLFMALNFDGGPLFDRVMLTISGTAMWLPLYALILWLVWRRSGWRGMSVFLVLMLLALRRAAMPHDWAVHVPPEAVSGMYGTVSAHAATIVALAVLSCGAIRRKWFTALMVVCTLVICYSRIYLGKHFPMDLVWGTLVGLGLGYAALRGYLRLAQSRNRRFTHPG